MKKVLTAIAAGALMSLGGLASAAEPVQLTDNQMDSVAAGQTSVATTAGFAAIGVVASAANTSAYQRVTPFTLTRVTTASAATISAGVLVGATASAASTF